jgi:hypothetical protein
MRLFGIILENIEKIKPNLAKEIEKYLIEQYKITIPLSPKYFTDHKDEAIALRERISEISSLYELQNPAAFHRFCMRLAGYVLDADPRYRRGVTEQKDLQFVKAPFAKTALRWWLDIKSQDHISMPEDAPIMCEDFQIINDAKRLGLNIDISKIFSYSQLKEAIEPFRNRDSVIDEYENMGFKCVFKSGPWKVYHIDHWLSGRQSTVHAGQTEHKAFEGASWCVKYRASFGTGRHFYLVVNKRKRFALINFENGEFKNFTNEPVGNSEYDKNSARELVNVWLTEGNFAMLFSIYGMLKRRGNDPFRGDWNFLEDSKKSYLLNYFRGTPEVRTAALSDPDAIVQYYKKFITEANSDLAAFKKVWPEGYFKLLDYYCVYLEPQSAASRDDRFEIGFSEYVIGWIAWFLDMYSRSITSGDQSSIREVSKKICQHFNGDRLPGEAKLASILKCYAFGQDNKADSDLLKLGCKTILKKVDSANTTDEPTINIIPLYTEVHNTIKAMLGQEAAGEIEYKIIAGQDANGLCYLLNKTTVDHEMRKKKIGHYYASVETCGIDKKRFKMIIETVVRQKCDNDLNSYFQVIPYFLWSLYTETELRRVYDYILKCFDRYILTNVNSQGTLPNTKHDRMQWIFSNFIRVFELSYPDKLNDLISVVARTNSPHLAVICVNNLLSYTRDKNLETVIFKDASSTINYRELMAKRGVDVYKTSGKVVGDNDTESFQAFQVLADKNYRSPEEMQKNIDILLRNIDHAIVFAVEHSGPWPQLEEVLRSKGTKEQIENYEKSVLLGVKME